MVRTCEIELGSEPFRNLLMAGEFLTVDSRYCGYSGDVFVFINASNNMMKLQLYEPAATSFCKLIRQGLCAFWARSVFG